MKNCYRYFSLCFLLLFGIEIQAQDIHYSQINNAPMILSPALVGVHYADIRFIGNYRSQWEAVAVDYQTFSGNIEKKFYLESLKNSYFGVGLVVDSDVAGTSRLSRTNIGVAGSYSRQMTSVLFLTAGAKLGISQRAFRTKDLTFDSQFNGDVFDPNLPRESFSRTNTMNFSLATGLNMRLQPEGAHPLNKRTKLDIGVGVHNLSTPRENFFLDETIRLPIRYTGYFMGTLMLNEVFDVLLKGSSQVQGNYVEHLVGLSGKIFIDKKPARELALVLGSSFRFNSFGDAIIPHAEIHFQRWLFGVSYDVNISDLRAATSLQGGIEFAVRYLIRFVDSSSKSKVCPII